jgi:hypothetical protein
MSLFTFSAYGSVLQVTAEDIAAELRGKVGLIEDGLTPLSTAYTIANRELLWKNSDAKEGCWMNRDEKEYYWQEGNYFD